MANKKLKKLTLDSLIEKAQNKESVKYIEFESEELGGILMIKPVSAKRFYEIIDMAEDDSVVSTFEANSQLIYECVPIFQEKSLQEAFECVEPYDVVAKIFDDNIGEITRLTEVITSAYGLDEDMLKN